MSTRRPKSVLDQDRFTAELSPGQLVIGVCILLMFGLACFLLGVLIGKFDPTLKPTTPTNIAADGEASPPEVKVAEMTVTPGAPPSVDTSTQSSLPPEMRVPPRIINETQPPPSATTPETTTPPAAVSAGDSTSSAAPPPAASTEPIVASSVEAAAEKNRVAPPAEAPKPVENPPAPAATETPAPQEAAAAWKGYGVQIIAVAKDRADAAKKSVESKSSYKARVLPHSKSNLFKVVVGPYADQAAATRARDELRSRFGYRDAFVLTLQ